MTTASPYTSAEHAFYDAHGYYVCPDPVLPQDLVAEAKAGMIEVREGRYDTGEAPFESPWNPGDDPSKLCKIENPHFANHAIQRLISHPSLGEAAARVSGASMVQVWWVQLLWKPPADPDATGGPSIGWHQDVKYWPEWRDGSQLFTAWVALSDVTEQAGPMKFIPDTHRHGLFDGGDFFSQTLDDQSEAIALPNGVAWNEVSAILPPGGVSFHDRFLLHGSSANRSDAPRLSFAIHLCTENSSVRDDHERIMTQFLEDPRRCPVIYDAG